MPTQPIKEIPPRLDIHGRELTDDTPVEEVALTEEEQAESAARAVVFVEHLERGDGADPSLQSVNETLMPGGAVLASEKQESLTVELPAGLADANVVKTLHDQRVRYDFAVTVTRIELDVEKKVVEKDSERHVVAASTRDYGPARYAVTWSALATLAVMVGQFALPFHRLATMLSTTTKRFTAGGLSQLLHYVATRLVPIYLELAKQVAKSEILAGDDTSCRVLEVAAYLGATDAEGEAPKRGKPPWADYQTPGAAEASFRKCEKERRARERLREDGDREAKRTPEEEASLGVLIGRKLCFASPRTGGA